MNIVNVKPLVFTVREDNLYQSNKASSFLQCRLICILCMSPLGNIEAYTFNRGGQIQK